MVMKRFQWGCATCWLPRPQKLDSAVAFKHGPAVVSNLDCSVRPPSHAPSDPYRQPARFKDSTQVYVPVIGHHPDDAHWELALPDQPVHVFIEVQLALQRPITKVAPPAFRDVNAWPLPALGASQLSSCSISQGLFQCGLRWHAEKRRETLLQEPTRRVQRGDPCAFTHQECAVHCGIPALDGRVCGRQPACTIQHV